MHKLHHAHCYYRIRYMLINHQASGFKRLLTKNNLVGCAAIVFVTLYLSHQNGPMPTVGDTRSVFDTEPGCSGALRTGNWKHSVAQCDTVLSTAAACDDQGNAWMWGAAAIDCGAHRLVSESWLRSIRGQRVVFVGDSTVRLLYTSFTRLAHGSGALPPGAKHNDAEEQLPHGVDAVFHWAPYPSNMTHLLLQWSSSSAPTAAALVLGGGLWHALHIHRDDLWQRDVAALATAVQQFHNTHNNHNAHKTHMFLVSISNPVPSKVGTWAKWWHMTPNRVARYNRDLAAAGIVRPRGPAFLLDLHHLSAACGAGCTHDGVHYTNATYDALVEVMGNVLGGGIRDR